MRAARAVPEPDEDLLTRLAGLHRAAFPSEERSWSAEEIGALAATGRLIALDDGTGFALISLAADEAEVLTVAVAPAARRRGAARALLDAAMTEAGRRGAATMFLEVAEDNSAAISLYRAAGFRETGRRPRYYLRGAARIDALLFSAAL